MKAPDPNKLERVRAALLRLAIKPGREATAETFARAVCLEAQVKNQLYGRYKPTAWAITVLIYWAYDLLTDEKPTRLIKEVEGRRGSQDVSECALLLDEIFAIFGIKASGAGQLRMAKRDGANFHKPR